MELVASGAWGSYVCSGSVGLLGIRERTCIDEPISRNPVGARSSVSLRFGSIDLYPAGECLICWGERKPNALAGEFHFWAEW